MVVYQDVISGRFVSRPKVSDEQIGEGLSQDRGRVIERLLTCENPTINDIHKVYNRQDAFFTGMSRPQWVNMFEKARKHLALVGVRGNWTNNPYHSRPDGYSIQNVPIEIKTKANGHISRADDEQIQRHCREVGRCYLLLLTGDGNIHFTLITHNR
jgi:hypothetical protein